MAEQKKSWWQRLFGSDEPDSDLPPKDSPLHRVPHISMDGDREWSVVAAEAEGTDSIFLRQQMLNHLSSAQVDELGERFAVPAQRMSGGKGRRVMAVITAVSNQNQLAELLIACQEIQPDVQWGEEE